MKIAMCLSMNIVNFYDRPDNISEHENVEEMIDKGYYHEVKGTVSRELRSMLLYIIGKLFSRPIVAWLKIFILLKGQFAMYIKPFSVS